MKRFVYHLAGGHPRIYQLVRILEDDPHFLPKLLRLFPLQRKDIVAIEEYAA